MTHKSNKTKVFAAILSAYFAIFLRINGINQNDFSESHKERKAFPFGQKNNWHKPIESNPMILWTI